MRESLNTQQNSTVNKLSQNHMSKGILTENTQRDALNLYSMESKKVLSIENYSSRVDIINIQDQEKPRHETIQSGLVKSLSSLQPYKNDERMNNTLSVNLKPNSISMMNKMRPVTAAIGRKNRPLSSFNANSSEKLLSISNYQPPKYLVPQILEVMETKP